MTAPRLHVVLLAGGSGTRFWPLSRRDRPKQLLRLFGPRSLLRATWDRARRVAPEGRIWLVAPEGLAARARAELPRLRKDRVVVEPAPRGTAAAIGLACASVRKTDPEAVVAVLPTDHLVRDPTVFARALRRAASAAGEGAVALLGVRPDRPATGFGYLEVGPADRRTGVRRVVRFREKPSAARARQWARSGRHLWNAGVFVARAGTILDAIGRHAPAVRRAVASGRSFRALPETSFDRAVLEKARDVVAVPLDAGWADVGTWEAAAALAEGGGRGGKSPHVVLDSPGSTVFGGRRPVAILDVPGVVVVDADDAVLVVGRSATERVREVVAAFAKAGRGDLL